MNQCEIAEIGFVLEQQQSTLELALLRLLAHQAELNSTSLKQCCQRDAYLKSSKM